MQSFVTNGMFWDEWLILDIHATEEIAGNDVDGWGLRVGGMCGMITHTTDEAAAFYLHIDRRGHEEFDTTTKGVDVDFLVFSNHGFAQIQSDAAAESIEAGTVEGLTVIDVLVAAVMNRAADALAVFTDGQRTLQPLIRIAAVTVDNKMYTNI